MRETTPYTHPGTQLACQRSLIHPLWNVPYRYSPGVLRVRIIDPRFTGLSRSDRRNLVMPSIRSLPEDAQLDITMLVLITEDELSSSGVNLEYEQPSPVEA